MPTRTIDIGNGHAFSPLWEAIDELRDEQKVTIDELADRLNVTRFCLHKRRERHTGFERLNECAAMFDALGWSMTLTISEKGTP